jgi:high-affinity nickel-transport protein
MRLGDLSGYAIGIVGLHAAGFGLLLAIAPSHPALVGLGALAYMLGLRHAFDADHVLAIDNAVRKLLAQRADPRGVGFFFSLGHSTVVLLLASTAILLGRVAIALPLLRSIGDVVGTVLSAGLLIVLGVMNLFVVFAIIDAIARQRRGLPASEALDAMLESRSLIARFARPLLRIVRKSAQAYPVGFVFGLGFDTASEVALLALSAGVAASGIDAIGLLSFPLLFAAGMTLMDTADGIFMTSAYGWALGSPMRKLYYNLTITGISVVGALTIGLFQIARI